MSLGTPFSIEDVGSCLDCGDSRPATQIFFSYLTTQWQTIVPLLLYLGIFFILASKKTAANQSGGRVLIGGWLIEILFLFGLYLGLIIPQTILATQCSPATPCGINKYQPYAIVFFLIWIALAVIIDRRYQKKSVSQKQRISLLVLKILLTIAIGTLATFVMLRGW